LKKNINWTERMKTKTKRKKMGLRAGSNINLMGGFNLEGDLAKENIWAKAGRAGPGERERDRNNLT